MTYLNPDASHSRTITAFFENDNAADKAVSDLERAGIPPANITLVPGNQAGAAEAGTESPGFWASLKDMFLPDEDRHVYAEGLRRGGYLLSVKTDEENYTKVLDIVDVEGSVDMDERESTWKSEGWKGYELAPMAPLGAMDGETAFGTTSEIMPPVMVATPPAMAATSSATIAPEPAPARAAPVAALGGKEEVIPVYEEKLQVGKRDVDHGRVRIRSYVVETPVNEQVTLRSEHAEIERKPVDRPVGAADALFQDRVVEVDEHAEEAVIAKEVRVKEEISLRKTEENKTQTVADTVRRTEVEIDDGRANGSGVAKFVATRDAGLIAEHMSVLASDGAKVGEVDHMDGPDKIKLTKSASPDGQHHYVPLAWVDHVDAHVHLNKPTADVRSGW